MRMTRKTFPCEFMMIWMDCDDLYSVFWLRTMIFDSNGGSETSGAGAPKPKCPPLRPMQTPIQRDRARDPSPDIDRTRVCHDVVKI